MLSPLEFKRRLRRSIEDRLLTMPMPLFRPAFAMSPDLGAQARTAIQQIHERSAFFPGVCLTPDNLRALNSALNLAFDGGRRDLKVTTNARTGIAQVHNPLRVHRAMLDLATDPFLCGVVERYLQRRIFLADVDVRRVPPMEMAELNRRAGTKEVGITSSHWHRDIRGRQVKIMVYLTDVGEHDSNFVFVPGTHAGHHLRPERIEESRFTDAWVAAVGIEPVECYGPAGTAMVFDTNLVHRLRRKGTGTVRDSVTLYYTPGQELRLLDVDEQAVAALPESARALFDGRRQGQD